MNTQEALLSCLPPVAYDRSASGVVAEAATTAHVMDLAHDGSQLVLREQQPDIAQAMFSDWERNYALPDSCVGGAAAPESARRANLLERVAGRGNLSRAYMLSIAERLGYPGCSISEPSLMTCADPCDGALNGPEFVGVWTLHVPVSTAVVQMTCTSPCDNALRTWGNTQLECVINRRKPAHTLALFAYAP